MANLGTTYLGLELKNPIIVGACGLTSDLSQIEKIEEADASAVALKSLFEEQIQLESLNAVNRETWTTDEPPAEQRPMDLHALAVCEGAHAGRGAYSQRDRLTERCLFTLQRIRMRPYV